MIGFRNVAFKTARNQDGENREIGKGKIRMEMKNKNI